MQYIYVYISLTQILTFQKLKYIAFYNYLFFSLNEGLSVFMSKQGMGSLIHMSPCLYCYPPDSAGQYGSCIFLLPSASTAPALLVLPLLWVWDLALTGHLLGLSPLFLVLLLGLI